MLSFPRLETTAEFIAENTDWVQHFEANRRCSWQIPWDSRFDLSAEEHRRIATSIAEFQRGESSEAHRYLAKSVQFSFQSGDPQFHIASILFVREENAHASLPLRFMGETGIARRERVWSDVIFRRLRGGNDLGWASRVLLVAELMAQTYYPCLRAATCHPALQRICDKIIGDEEAHIRFQVQRIAHVEERRPGYELRLRDFAQTVVMLGAAGAVYFGHHKVIRCRLGWRAFLAEVLHRNRTALAAIHRRRLTLFKPASVQDRE